MLLNRGLPKRGRKIFADGTQRFEPLKLTAPGDHVMALTGEKVVLDGIVIAGEGVCDESIMTGEAWPMAKNVGSKVMAGSIVQQGHLKYCVERTIEQTTLHSIVEMIESEIGNKVSYVRHIDQIVAWFVPLVIVIAFLTGISWYMYANVETAVVRAISVLLISCPCAIGIAVPLADSYLINGMANLGAIVRNRRCLSILGNEDVFIFDKTGTITEGNFDVLDGLQNRLLKSDLF